jgi:ribonucleotide monophosphatase NagD (HAD superfamily)
VSASGKRWAAQIYYDNKDHHLGSFDTKQEAALAYDREARQCGQNKLLNYESIKAAEDAAVQSQAEYTLAHPKQPKPRPASGFYGVSAKGKRWGAKICYNNTQHNLGTFDTKQEAALAYDRKARQCGEDKLLNYESIKTAEEAAAEAQAEHILVHDMCAGPQQPKPRPSSGFYGVSAKGKRWAAQIYYDSKNHYLGIFDTKQEAALAYDRAAMQCGEDRPLNYESIKAAEEAAVQAQAEYTLVYPKQPKPRPASGFYGVSVSASKKRWAATVRYDNKKHNLGCFDTKQEAALAYDRKARQCGEDKLLNYESIRAAEEAAAEAQAEHILVHDMCAGPQQPKPRPASGFYGVSASANGKRWAATIYYDSKKHNLCTFDTKQEAALAYDRAARQCGEDRPLNYDSIKAAEEAAAAAAAAASAPTAGLRLSPTLRMSKS